MTVPGVDCSRPISGASLASAGKVFVGRYYSSFNDTKDLTQAEAADILSHGVGILAIGEDGANDLTSGVPHAQALAHAYVARAQAEGQPTGTGIVMTCDNNGAAPAGVEQAMTAAAVILRAGGYKAGFYGPKVEAAALMHSGSIDFTFPVDTWNEGWSGDDTQWNYRQLPNAGYQTIGGVTCDTDDAPHPIGLWLAQTPTPPSVERPLMDRAGLISFLANAICARDASAAELYTYGDPAKTSDRQVVVYFEDTPDGTAIKQTRRAAAGLS